MNKKWNVVSHEQYTLIHAKHNLKHIVVRLYKTLLMNCFFLCWFGVPWSRKWSQYLVLQLRFQNLNYENFNMWITTSFVCSTIKSLLVTNFGWISFRNWMKLNQFLNTITFRLKCKLKVEIKSNLNLIEFFGIFNLIQHSKKLVLFLIYLLSDYLHV